MKKTNQLLFLTLVTLSASVTVQAENAWNQFRGPNGSGVDVTATLPVEFGPEKNVRWKSVPLPMGHSSPVIWGERIFLTGFEKGRLETLCLSRESGEILWRKKAPEVEIEKHHEDNNPASSTPFVDAERLYVYFGSYGLLCYDHAGKELWRRPVPTPVNMHGVGTSPVVHEDYLYLMRDSMDGDSYLLALQAKNGKDAWKTKRLAFNPNWSTPVVWKHDKGTELVLLGGGALTSYEPQSGKEIWKVTGFGSSIPVPIVGERYIYASTLSGTDGDIKFDFANWEFYLGFDKNGDGRVALDEIPETSTIQSDPSRPEDRRPTREVATWIDQDRDKVISKEEHVGFVKLIQVDVRSSIQAVRPGGRGDVTDTHVVWKHERSIPFMPSCLHLDGLIYMPKSGGVVTCLDAETGKRVFRQRLRGGGNYVASPVATKDHVYLFSRRGVVNVLQAGDSPKEIARNDLEDSIDATPAMAGDTLYIRTGSCLYAFTQHALN